jgi:hypothetical protein
VSVTGAIFAAMSWHRKIPPRIEPWISNAPDPASLGFDCQCAMAVELMVAVLHHNPRGSCSRDQVVPALCWLDSLGQRRGGSAWRDSSSNSRIARELYIYHDDSHSTGLCALHRVLGPRRACVSRRQGGRRVQLLSHARWLIFGRNCWTHGHKKLLVNVDCWDDGLPKVPKCSLMWMAGTTMRTSDMSGFHDSYF